ncbi:MAG: alpha/beta fold hydrolase [Gammaproteobacteria bacterium]|nr:alpha/beta fold hydrolase [Gammaproteobacteria bacterium]
MRKTGYLRTILFSIAISSAIILLSGCTHLIFYPERQHYLTPEQVGIVANDVYFKTTDGLRLHGWFLPAKTKITKGTVLFAHGNAQNISTHVASVFWLPDYGYNVFLFDYRGYGYSEGETELENLQLDFNAALDHLFNMPNIDPDNILIFGQSLGAAVAIHGTAYHPQRKKLRGIITEGAFDSYRHIAQEALDSFWLTWPLQWLLSYTISDCCRPIDAAPFISPLPLLIIHSKHDEIIPVHHAYDIYERAKEPKSLWIYEGYRHIQIFTINKNRERLVSYIDQLLSNSEKMK